jgi:hypothetical protein
MTLTRFLHISPNKHKFSKKNYRKPRLHHRGGLNNNYNLYEAIYLSKVSGNGVSNWVNYRRKVFQCKNADSSYDDDFNENDPWLSSKNWYYFDIDFNKHKIYIVDSPHDFLNLIIDYGYFNFISVYQKFEDCTKNKKNDEIRIKNLIPHTLFNKFFNDLDNEYKELIQSNKITQLVEFRNKRNMPLLKIFKGQVVKSRNIITNEFLADLVRTKNYYDDIIGDVESLKKIIYIYLATYDFFKLNKDGYKGIYYTQNVIKLNKNKCIINEDCTCRYGIGIDKKDIPRITRTPKIMERMGLKINDQFQQGINDTIYDLTRWLGSEQLMVWDWIFD